MSTNRVQKSVKPVALGHTRSAIEDEEEIV
jgi:hypothetical protein